LPEPVEYAGLFETTGWNATYKASLAELESSLIGSWFGVSAYVAGRLVGFGRVLSDGVLYALLVDVIVHPDFRRHGIGSEIVQRLIKKCVGSGIRDIQLFSSAGKVEFYEKLGFKIRHEDAPGMRLTTTARSGPHF
jgi:GNAT superfamily N-acetyltransferase